MSAPADAAFGFYGNGAWLVSAFFPVQDFQVVEVGLEYAGVAHNAHLKRFLGRLVREEAEVQRAFRAVVVFPTDSRVVVRLIGAGDDSVDGVTAKGADEFGACAEPPIHQIKMMAIFVYETTAAFAPVLNPIAAFGLKWPAEFFAPSHMWRAHCTGVDQCFYLCKIGRVAQLVANHQYPIAAFGGTKELAAFGRRDANGFLQENMFTRLERRQRKWHVRKVGRGNHYRIEVTLDEVFFFFEQRHIWRDLYCPPDASGIAGAQRNSFCLFAAVLVE